MENEKMEKPDFSKIWGENGNVTYQFSDDNYLKGWGFVGNIPPARGMFDAYFQGTDKKLKWLDNALGDYVNRDYTIDDTKNPTDNKDTLPNLLSGMANIIKTTNGTDDWKKTSATSLKDLSDQIASNNLYHAEATGYGIVSGCEPTISGLTVTVGAGVVHLADGTRKEIAETSITLDNAASTNPRIDLVYIDSTGTVAKVTGTAAASPSAPDVPPSGGISVCNVTVAAGATTGIVIDSRSMLSRFYNTGIVNVKDFGAVGDGIHDDTEAIQNALNAGSTVIFPDGIYMVDAVKNLKLVSRENMHIIISPNAEVKSITTSEPHYYIFALLRCKNITIDGGGKITGDVDTHTGTDGEWGYGIQIYHSSNILIDNIEINKLWGDGVYIGDYIDGTHSENVTVRNCYIHHNRRQGISVGYGRDILIDSCLITDIAGTAPQAGIDIETEGNASTLEAQKNIRVSNTTIKNCAGYSIMTVGLMENINITDCTLDKYLVNGLNGNVSINNCNLSGEIRGEEPFDGASLTIENCTADGDVVSGMPITKIHGGKYANIFTVGNGEIKVDDCKTGAFNSSGKSSVNNSTMTSIDISGSDNRFNSCTIIKNITSTTGADAFFNDCNISAVIWGSTFNILSFANCRIISDSSPQVTITQKYTLKNCSFIVTAKNWFFPITAKDAECIFINNDFNFDAVQSNDMNEGLIGAWAKTVRVMGNVFRNVNAISYPIHCGYSASPCYLLQSQNNIALDTVQCVSTTMGSGGKKYIINDITSQTNPS